LVEAADANGDGRFRKLSKVEMPLAMPIIMEGIKIDGIDYCVQQPLRL